MKREALLDCFDTARGRYDQAWARTSVDIAIQAGHFCSACVGTPEGALRTSLILSLLALLCRSHGLCSTLTGICTSPACLFGGESTGSRVWHAL